MNLDFLERKKVFLEKVLKKENLFLLMLAGILILVVAWPLPDAEAENVMAEAGVVGRENVMPAATEIENYQRETEERLEEILSSMEGVGECRVMITLATSYESIVLRDTDSSSRESEDSGGEETHHESEEADLTTTVFYTDAEGNEVPYCVQTIYPEVEGVVVVAQGAGDAETVINITDAIQALFGIEAHKIRVVKMKI